MVDYKRTITNQDYKNPDKLKKYYHRVVKQIYKNSIPLDKKFVTGKFTDYRYCNETIYRWCSKS